MTLPLFLAGVPFQAIALDTIAASLHPGTSGTATMREVEVGHFRLRHIEYSVGYQSDQYCNLGHIAFIIEGEVELVMRGRESSLLAAGTSFVVGAQAEPHLVRSRKGAKLFVLD